MFAVMALALLSLSCCHGEEDVPAPDEGPDESTTEKTAKLQDRDHHVAMENWPHINPEQKLHLGALDHSGGSGVVAKRRRIEKTMKFLDTIFEEKSESGDVGKKYSRPQMKDGDIGTSVGIKGMGPSHGPVGGLMVSGMYERSRQAMLKYLMSFKHALTLIFHTLMGADRITNDIGIFLVVAERFQKLTKEWVMRFASWAESGKRRRRKK